MEIDGLDAVPRKWLDKKQYVRVDPTTGVPQLVRVEPVVSETGELDPDSVAVFIDDKVGMLMAREAAAMYVESLGCTPLEITTQWKHRKIH
jgi:hypothetical protein